MIEGNPSNSTERGDRKARAIVLLRPGIRPPGDLMYALHQWDADIHICRSTVAAMGVLTRLRALLSPMTSSSTDDEECPETDDRSMTILLVVEPDDWTDLDDFLKAVDHYHPQAFVWGYRSESTPAVAQLKQHVPESVVAHRDSTPARPQTPSARDLSSASDLEEPVAGDRQISHAPPARIVEASEGDIDEPDDGSDESPIPFPAVDELDNDAEEAADEPPALHLNSDDEWKSVKPPDEAGYAEIEDEDFEEVVAPPTFEHGPELRDAEIELEQQFPFLPNQQLRLTVSEYEEEAEAVREGGVPGRELDRNGAPDTDKIDQDDVEADQDATLVTEDELAMLLGDSDFTFDDEEDDEGGDPNGSGHRDRPARERKGGRS